MSEQEGDANGQPTGENFIAELYAGRLKEAREILRKLSDLTREECQELADFLDDDASLQPLVPWKLKLVRRQVGRPGHQLGDRAWQFAIGLYVRKLVQEGLKVEAAVQTVMQRSGLRRSAVFNAYKRVRKCNSSPEN